METQNIRKNSIIPSLILTFLLTQANALHNPVGGPAMQFPLTFGGFAGGMTVIEDLAIDYDMNAPIPTDCLAILCFSKDSQLVSNTSGEYMVFYLEVGQPGYTWAKRYPSLYATTVKDIELITANNAVAMLQNTFNLIIISTLDGTVSAEYAISTLDMNCNTGGSCGIFTSLSLPNTLVMYYQSQHSVYLDAICITTFNLQTNTFDNTNTCVQGVIKNNYQSASFTSPLMTLSVLSPTPELGYILSLVGFQNNLPATTDITLTSLMYMQLELKSGGLYSPQLVRQVMIDNGQAPDSTYLIAGCIGNYSGRYTIDFFLTSHIVLPNGGAGSISGSSVANGAIHRQTRLSTVQSSVLDCYQTYIPTSPSTYVYFIYGYDDYIQLGQAAFGATSLTLSYSNFYHGAGFLEGILSQSMTVYYSVSTIDDNGGFTSSAMNQSYMSVPSVFCTSSQQSFEMFTLVTGSPTGVYQLTYWSNLTLQFINQPPLILTTLLTTISSGMTSPDVKIPSDPFSAIDVCIVPENVPTPYYATIPNQQYYLPNVAMDFIVTDAANSISFCTLYDCLYTYYTLSISTNYSQLPPFVTFDNTTGTLSVQDTTTLANYAYNQTDITVARVGQLNPDFYYSVCRVGDTLFDLSLIYLGIITQPVYNMNYNISGQLSTIQLWYLACSDSRATSLNYSRVYNITKLDGTLIQNDPTLSSFIITYTNTLLVLHVQTANLALAGIYQMMYTARFYNFNAPYIVTQVFNLTLFDPCYNALINMTQQSPQSLYYFIGEAEFYAAYTQWYIWVTEPCGTFTYSASFNESASTGTATSSILKVAYNVTHFNISVFSDILSDIGVYSVVVYGAIMKNATTIYTNSTFTVNLYVISSTISCTMNSYVLSYYIDDPIMTYTFQQFTSTDTRFSILNQILNSSLGTTIDSTLYTYNNISRTLSIQSNNLAKIGQQTMNLRSYFNISNYYTYYVQVTVNIYSPCYRNLIQSPVVPMIKYDISTQSPYNYSLANWTMNMSNALCGEIVYSATQQSGQALPNFVQYDVLANSLFLYSVDPNDIGSYQIQVTGETQYYNPISTPISTFTIEVVCTVLEIVPQDSSFQKIYTNNGVSQVLLVSFQPFIFTPDCSTITNPIIVTYSARLANTEGPLPNYIQFQSNTRTFIILQSPLMVQGIINIEVVGSVGTLLSSFTWSLLVNVPLQTLSSTGHTLDIQNFITLPALEYKVSVNSKLIITSDSLNQYSSEAYQLLQPSQNDFIQIKGQTITALPSSNDAVGTQEQLQLGVTNSTSGTLYVQIITITITGQNLTSQVSSNQKIVHTPTASITDISRSGMVEIQFSERLIIKERDYESILNDTTNIIALTIKQSPKNQVGTFNFTSNVTQITNFTLFIQLDFQNPLLVSPIV